MIKNMNLSIQFFYIKSKTLFLNILIKNGISNIFITSFPLIVIFFH